MSKFSFSSVPNTTNSKKPQFSSLLLSDLLLFCSFILSHPLYFSYFIFFSPYIIKILSFLSPLFITTSLLLLALFTNLVHDNSCLQHSESKLGFLFTTYHNVLENLRSNADNENEEFPRFEELEAYKIVFDTSILEIRENSVQVLKQESKENCLPSFEEAPVDKYSTHESFSTNVSQGLISNVNESLSEIMRAETAQLIAGQKTLEGFLKEDNEFVDVSCEKVEKEVKPLSVEFNKGEEQKEEPAMRSGSKALGTKISEAKATADDRVEYWSKVRVNSQRLGSDLWSNDNDGEYPSKVMENSQPLVSNLGSYGSMRKEKEWRRTLACKLFEERHNVEGSEGMDSLWETYEKDSNKLQTKNKTKKGKKGGNVHYDEEEEEEDEEIDDGQLCCLQALKFSAGKMNLGMGRPNLVKISKALKGIGWLHHVTKHGKKVYR